LPPNLRGSRCDDSDSEFNSLSRAEALFTLCATHHASVEGRRVLADLRLLRERERKERWTRSVTRPTEREARPYCDRPTVESASERENQRKEGDGRMGWFWHSGVIRVVYTLQRTETVSGARLRNTVTFISFLAGSERARAPFELEAWKKRERGRSQPSVHYVDFAQEASRPASLSPPPPNVKYEYAGGGCFRGGCVVRSGLSSVWVPCMSTSEARGKDCCATIHTVTHIH